MQQATYETKEVEIICPSGTKRIVICGRFVEKERSIDYSYVCNQRKPHGIWIKFEQ